MKNTPENTPASEVVTLTPVIDAKVEIDQHQIINVGISRREDNLDAAHAAMDAQLRPLIKRHQEIGAEIVELLPRAAEKACESFKADIVNAFKPLRLKVEFQVSGAQIVSDQKASATLRAYGKASDAYMHSSGGISSVVEFDLPENIVEKRVALATLDQQLAAGREYQVQIKQELANLPRRKRQLEGALAEKLLGKTEAGREMLDVVNDTLAAIPDAPDLLLLGNGGHALTAPKAKRAKAAKVSAQSK